MKLIMKKIYKFLGKYDLLFSIINGPVSLLLGFSLRRCIVSQMWVLFGITIFAILLWLVVLVISSHSYVHMHKQVPDV